MPSEFPISIRAALEKAATLLGDSLLGLNYPNGGKDAVFAEANLIVYTAHALLSAERSFHCYAEPSHAGSKRIDLVAFDGETAVAVEAKKFGNVAYGSLAILSDIDRLRGFRPSLSPSADDSPVEEWWANAANRWGVILVGSHGGDQVRDAWQATTIESARTALDGRLAARGARRTATVQADNTAMLAVLNKLDSMADTSRGVFQICPGNRWRQCEDAYLLWAGFRLT